MVITGATGNIGSSVIEMSGEFPEIEEIIGVSRRRPTWDPPRTTWVEADVTVDDLEPVFDGSDVVMHLVWAIQPSRDVALQERVNVQGSCRVFEAAARAGVPRIVYASSVGAYSEGPTDRRIGEDWPTGSIGTSTYSRHKAAVENLLDGFEREHPDIEVVRMRPGLIFKGDAASEIRRLFAGPFLPGRLLEPDLIPLAPSLKGLCFQAVHSHDVGRAFLEAATREGVTGAFNVAADPPIGSEELSEVFEAPPLELSPRLVRGLADLTWRLRVQPSEAGWIDLAMGSPLMSTERARTELEWDPRFSSLDALRELLDGFREGRGHSAPHLRRSGIADRIDELRTGVGKRQWIRSRSRQIRKYLTDVHSIEEQAIIQMRYAPRLARDPDLADQFEVHLDETAVHEERVRNRLEQLGAGPSRIKDAAGTVGGFGMLAFARSQPDTPGKLAAHAFSYEHMELAAYEILAAYADRAGDGETASLARQIATEERMMAWRVEAHFDQAVAASLSDRTDSLDIQLARYMADAHALENQGHEFFSRARELLDDRDLRSVLTICRDSSAVQKAVLEQSLRERGHRTHPVKDAPLGLGGIGVTAFLAVQPDPNTKVAGFAYAFQNLLVGSNELLRRVASLAGDERVADLAEARATEMRDAASDVAATWVRMGGV